jgi:hypothetical protein
MNRINHNIGPRLPLVLGSVGVACYLLIALIELANLSYRFAAFFLVVPLLVVISVPMLAKARRAEPDPWIGRLFTFALLAMMSMGVVHILLSALLYRGGDAAQYDSEGAAIGAQFWHGDFIPHLDRSLIGNGFIYVITGIIYAVIGPTVAGGYLVYSWVAFWGIYFCYVAFRTALPFADRRRYAVLVFFLPSILFWPSAISKETPMILCTGLTLLGAARLLNRMSRWVVPLLVGLAGTALVRPHITAILIAGLFAGVLVRKISNPTLLTPIMQVASIVMVFLIAAVVIRVAANFLQLDTVSASSVTGALNKVQQNSAEGNSTFTAQPVNSPLALPGAIITVLFRPFPWEAANPVMLASSAESTLSMVFLALSWPRWRYVPRMLRRNPYLMVALIVILLFVIAFATIGNFGLLVRQRSTVLPLVLVPLCLARRTHAKIGNTDSSTVERAAFQ